jgi:hypothetical protein
VFWHKGNFALNFAFRFYTSGCFVVSVNRILQFFHFSPFLSVAPFTACSLAQRGKSKEGERLNANVPTVEFLLKVFALGDSLLFDYFLFVISRIPFTSLILFTLG